MVEIQPLRGLRYSAPYAGEAVLAPPYDVIDAAQREALLAASPYNAVRLELGPEGDACWHAGAAALLRRWIADGILVRDSIPAFYGYQQHFSLADGSTRARTGFFARVRLRPWGEGIHRHEHTRVGPREDRLALMRATHTNMSPVFGLYRDPQGELAHWLKPLEGPLLDICDADGVRHVLWRISDLVAMAALIEGLAQRDVVIADGHHRYETALAYRDERRAAAGNPPEPQPYDDVMMVLIAAEDPGLVILPTHRVIRGEPEMDPQGLITALAQDFEAEPVNGGSSVEEATRRAGREALALGLCLDGAGSWTLRLKDLDAARRAAAGHDAPDLAELDVVVLQNLILGPHLGLSAETLARTDRVAYTIDAERACAQAHAGHAQAAFILNPTTVEQVWLAALHGVTMPQKSTYFYPKLPTGLLFNPLDEA